MSKLSEMIFLYNFVLESMFLIIFSRIPINKIQRSEKFISQSLFTLYIKSRFQIIKFSYLPSGPKSKMQGTIERKKFEDMKKALQQRDYEIIKSIGKGAFGQVVLARNKKQELFAVKIISKTHFKKKPFLEKYINQEISIMKQLHHPNIVRYGEQFRTSDFIVIIMEYCQMGNLLTYQAKLPGKTFTLKQALKVMVEVMKGLKCIHEKNFIHRDIKSENVLLKKIFKDKDSYEVGYKIADFGFARSIGSSGAKTHCGTEKYMAPQILSNSYYGISVDIWALGVLFYFMLFAEYPFKGHDMKAQITRRCQPYFSIQATVTKKQKLKDVTPQLEDFFKKIFVVDPKKRIQFSELKDHPVFSDFSNEFKETNIFYKNYEKKQEYVKDEVQPNEYGMDSQMQPQDQSRTQLIKKKQISPASKHLQKELEEIFFQIQKVDYLKQCAIEIFDTYTSYLRYPERLAAKFYLLKAYLFYGQPLLQSLMNSQIPQSLNEINISQNKFLQCTKTVEYKKKVNKLNEEIMKTQILFEDTYNEVATVLNEIPIKNFDKGYKLAITQKTFDGLKFAYRSTTSYIFKIIHENKKIDSHTRNKIKMRLFCCHMINRIFNRKQIKDHFPFFIVWLEKKKYQYSHTFDFTFFKKWIYEETQQNLEKNISLLHKTFF